MSVKNENCSLFTLEQIREVYENKVRLHATVGLDRITPQAFNNNLEEHIALVCRKVNDGTYKFSHYREMLISKGRGKEPRIISIPTIRDKLVLAVLHSALQNSFAGIVKEPLLHTIIGDITKTIAFKKYDSYVKIDIRHFYSSIDHDLLKNKIARKISDERIIKLVHDAITTETIAVNEPVPKREPITFGVPEGLSISNILADIYLNDLGDLISKQFPNSVFFRYVDDILVLCTEKDASKIKNYTIQLLKKSYKLENHEEKTKTAKLELGVPYLGYVFYADKVSIRKEATHHMENALEELFRLRKRNEISEALFEWRLNIKIAGCIHNRKKYGWMFYYSQLTDITILYHLDWVVDRLFKRFKFAPPRDLKRFVRVYHEIIKNLSKSQYLINTENFSISQKKDILLLATNQHFPAEIEEGIVDAYFQRLMFKEVQKLERDIQNFS